MYYALYRKYRPTVFDDVLGQPAVTETLRRQVASGQISHAYLFTGTRGTGKTTCAKILARAVNCLHPVNGNPCNECEICKGIADGSIYDVEEIDAASNNGVDNIRQIRDEVVYAPNSAKYKVYIIDEVHMLSAGAFNALLKTLEEPPAHVIFILATTEVHKVPATILSRCQRFDFRRLTRETLKKQIEGIAAKEGKTLDPSTVRLIADLADGGSRDALSLLDKVIDLESYDLAAQVLGVMNSESLRALAGAIADADTDTIYASVAELYATAADLGRMLTDLMDLFKQLLVFKTASRAATLLEKSEEEAQTLRALSERFPAERLIFSMNLLQETVLGLPRSCDRRADTEVCLLRLARPDLLPENEALAARVALLEQQVRALGQTPVSVPTPAEPVKKAPKPVFEDPFASDFDSAPAYREPEERSVRAAEPKPAPKPAEPPVERKPAERPAPAAKPAAEGEWQELQSWPELCDSVFKEDHFFGMMLQGVVAVYRGHDIVLPVSDDQKFVIIRRPENVAMIQNALKAARKEGYVLRVENVSPDRYLAGATLSRMEKDHLFTYDDNVPEEFL